MSLVVFLVVALLVGWVGGLMMGRSLGLASSLVVGVLGVLVGGFTFRLLASYVDVNVDRDLPPYVFSLATGTLGALLVLALIGTVEQRR
jgi:uncharacterized membrane protein YeaQ/YmgE (transglycosylase-associated protein family)